MSQQHEVLRTAVCSRNMALHFDPASILQESNVERFDHHLHQSAEQLAVLDAVDVARALIELFLRLSVTGSYDHWLDRLIFAWNETASWPAEYPTEHRSADSLNDHRENSINAYWGESRDFAVPESMRTWDERGLSACLNIDFGEDKDGGVPWCCWRCLAAFVCLASVRDDSNLSSSALMLLRDLDLPIAVDSYPAGVLPK